MNNIDESRVFDLDPVIKQLATDKKVSISGLAGSPLSLFVGELQRRISPLLFLPPAQNADRYFEEIVRLVPATIKVDGDQPYFKPARVVVSSADHLGLNLRAVSPVVFSKAAAIDVETLLGRFAATGYTREQTVEEENEYALRGGILDFYPAGQEPVRVEMEGNVIHSVRRFNAQTQRSTGEVESVSAELGELAAGMPFADLAAESCVIAFREIPVGKSSIVIAPAAERHFAVGPAPRYYGNFQLLAADIMSPARRHVFLIDNPVLEQRLRDLLGEIAIVRLPLLEGFADGRTGTVYLTEYEIFGRIRPKREKFKGLFIDDLKGLAVGDYVVHSDYGIGQYRGLTEIDVERCPVECLRVDYADSARIYVPVEKMNQLERYVSSTGVPPRLSRLGSSLWIKTKSRIKKATEKLALELLQLYARRQTAPGYRFSADTGEMAELESSFPYEETADQKKAIAETKSDMESAKPLDRLVCGDVGYGKTEVALRAAFKAALDSVQTLIVCPTTLLAFQHYNTFARRLAPFPVRVAMVSRLKKRDEIKKTLAEIKDGAVDIAIGTHRLLQSDVHFKNLGLLVVDEEQRFGVGQKEKIKRLKPGIDILYLSATPIPRTLYMALTGIKDISNIRTPPAGRRDIITRIIHFDDNEIRRIISLEIMRGGQVFFVHNRIQTIETVGQRLRSILPDLKFCILHGRVKEELTERKMVEFLDGRYDLLLATAIIESGLDMPRVNTIIVNESHTFGLADLHQLRGRVGRSDIQAHAYFIVPERPLSGDAHKRLSALVSYASLGSGFRLAMRDMEIRGIGNLLGREQSGYVNSIGYFHYIKMLNRTISEARGLRPAAEPVLALNLDAFLPGTYIEDAYERTALYKRLMDVEARFELDSIRAEIADRFGRYPREVENLFLLSSIRLTAIELGCSEVRRRAGEIQYFRDGVVVKSETCP